MKKSLSLLLAVMMIVALLIPAASAAGAYEGKTVVIYTGNLNGDVDQYAKVAAAKADYAAKGADVLLVDAGNYLQGKAAANVDRGLSVYNLMDAAGYDAAAMGTREFFYADATTGMIYHANLHKYFTQAELLRGAEAEEYRINAPWAAEAVMDSRDAKAPAAFKVISSNVTKGEDATGYYDFDASAGFFDGAVTVYALTDTTVPALLQDDFAKGYTFGDPAAVRFGGGISVCLNNSGVEVKGATVTVSITNDGEAVCGVYVIDNATKAVTEEKLPNVTPDAEVAKLAADAKAAGEADKIAVNDVTLCGADSIGWKEETNLGDLVADALKWYAENKFDGFQKDAPVVAIQNGGNCDQFLYPGDVTKTDLLRALPFSPMGVGILYVTGNDLLTLLEAGTSPSSDYGEELCPGFGQVAGVEYAVHKYKEYLAGEEYGKFFRAKEINRVEIKSAAGKDFDPKATYALITDNYLMNGNDTAYVIKDIRDGENAKYLNNGNGVKTRDIVAMYIDQVLGGKIGEAYAKPQGRITVYLEEPYENPFTDVKDDAWYADSVAYAVKHGLFKGMTQTTFELETAMSRAMFVTVLYRMAGEPDASKYDNPFDDVKDGAWYTDAVCWAAGNDIVRGVSATRFDPDADVTREQSATLLLRYANFKKYDVSAKDDLAAFTDAGTVSSWAKDAVQWAVGAKLIQGVTAKTIVPQGNATRAQVATILMRFCENAAK